MKNDNLAYDGRYRLDTRLDASDVSNITNIRMTGGVMFKADGTKKVKSNNSANTIKKPKARPQRATVISVVVLVAMAFLVLFRGLMITAGYDKLEEKNILLSEMIAENQKLQFKIDQALDLKNIEKIAKDTFNMGQPTKAQMIYINLDQENEVKKVREGNTVIEAVKSFFAGIVEYFN